ncbi:MAG: glycoside hydrolase family 92 protein [Ekhidna sp.]|nr:glycoside hydrolase family 92 protein [Ekhidna sp.]MBC6426659.1 glycoside hydrolase family 92 protein [Ekhidna sp.]
MIKSTILKVSENGFFTINTLNNTKENKYVSKVLLNGKELENKQISYFSIQAGNELTIYMAAKP